MVGKTRFATALISAIAAGWLGLATSAAVADTIDWKTISGWDISFYPGSAGCQALAQFEEGTAFFIGFDNNDNVLAVDVTLLDNRWSSIEDGKEYAIKVFFGNETPWDMSMKGVVLDGYPGLNIMIDAGSDQASLFIDEFQRETSMAWKYGATTLGRYTLRGSRRAFDEVIACQKSYMAATSSGSDPFKKSDPFAQ